MSPSRWRPLAAGLRAAALGLFLAAAPASADVAPRDVRAVDSAYALVAALGSHRTIRLAAGDYDLGAVPKFPSTVVRWEGDPDSRQGQLRRLVVHDLEDVAIEGPATGEARLRSSICLRLEFEAVRGVRMRRLVWERSGQFRAAGDPPPGLADIRFSESGELELAAVEVRGGNAVDSDDAATLGFYRTHGVQLSAFSGPARLRLELWSATDVRLADSVLVADDVPPFAFFFDSGLSLSDVRIEAEAPAGQRLEGLFAPNDHGSPTVTIDGVTLVDRVTGAVRLVATHGALDVAHHPNRLRLPFAVIRSAPRQRADGRDYEVSVRLLDGRSPIVLEPLSAENEGAFADDGIAANSISVVRLGGVAAPALVRWTDHVQGMGAYQNRCFRVIAPPPGGTTWVAGCSESGHEGNNEGAEGSVDVAADDDTLVVRWRTRSWDTRTPAGDGLSRPGPRAASDWIRESLQVDELVYRPYGRADGEPVVLAEAAECRRVEPTDDVGGLLAAGWQPSLPADDRPPGPGDWLRRRLEPALAEVRHPRLGTIGEPSGTTSGP